MSLFQEYLEQVNPKFKGDLNDKLRYIEKMLKKADDELLVQIGGYVFGDLSEYNIDPGSDEYDSDDLDRLYDDLMEELPKLTTKTVNKLYDLLK